MARGKTETPDEGGSRNTERLVLVRLDLQLPTGVQEIDAAIPPDLVDANGVVEAWVPVLHSSGAVRVFRGSKRKAIDSFAVDEETGEERPGAYKAPSLTSWRGTRKIVLPEKPRADRLWED